MQKFDPWGSRLCTCPPKYSLSPYTGCGHCCAYCYITSYIPKAFQPRKKKNFLATLKRELEAADKSLPISMSNSSDPYTPPEKYENLTRLALGQILRSGFKVMITTKSSLVTRDIDIFKKENTAVAITITTMNAKIARKIEPCAPSPQERIKAARILTNSGIKTIIRLDPIIPYINDDYASLAAVVRQAEAANATGIIASTFKPRADSLKRICALNTEFAAGYKHIYVEKIGRTLYMSKNARYSILKSVRELCDEHGLRFATCREGFPELHTAPSCDGTHLLS